MANTYRIKIFNRELNITTDQTLEYTQWLADKLNEKLGTITQGVGNITLTDAAVMVALDSLDKAVKSEESTQNIRSQIKKYADDATAAEQKAADKDSEIARLQKRIKELEERAAKPAAQTAASAPAQTRPASSVFVPKKDISDKTGGQTSFFK